MSSNTLRIHVWYTYLRHLAVFFLMVNVSKYTCVLSANFRDWLHWTPVMPQEVWCINLYSSTSRRGEHTTWCFLERWTDIKLMCIGKCKYTIHESIMGKYNYRAPGSRRLSEVLLSDPSDFVGGINCFDGHNEPRQVRHDRLWDAAVFFWGKKHRKLFWGSWK